MEFAWLKLREFVRFGTVGSFSDQRQNGIGIYRGPRGPRGPQPDSGLVVKLIGEIVS